MFRQRQIPPSLDLGSIPPPGVDPPQPPARTGGCPVSAFGHSIVFHSDGEPLRLSTDAPSGRVESPEGANAGAMSTLSIGLPGPPLLVSDDEGLVDELLGLCAAAAVTPDVVRSSSRIRRPWSKASCVLVGADLAADVARVDLARRPDVILTARAPEPADVWQTAVALGAEHVAILPQAQPWLIGRLADTLDGDAEGASTVAVMGARGGAGASTLAAGLGLAAASRGATSMLVDLDPFGGGIELVVGSEHISGLRWPELSETRGRVSASALRSALPSVGGLSVLSWDRGKQLDITPAAIQAMIAAGRRGADVLILDLARRLDESAGVAVQAADILLVVCTADVRSTASAARVLAQLRPLCTDIRLVIRTVRGGDLDHEAIAAALQLPLMGTVPTQRSLSRAVNEGLGLPAHGRFASHCGALLKTLGLAEGAAR